MSKAARLLYAVIAALISVSSAVPVTAAELGVYRWDAPTGPANVDSFSQWLGRPVNLAAAFEANDSWDNIDGAEWQLGAWSQWVSQQPGRNLVLAVPMLPSSGATLAECSAGKYDAYWANLANNLAYYRLHWAYLRLGWEMDGGWYAWGAPQGSGKEASYAGCFRRIVQVMRQTQPANQWKFVWNPTTAWWEVTYLAAVWPGDAYVDIVGIDLYDQSWATGTYPYPSSCDATCQLAAQQTAWNDHSWKLNVVRDFGLARGKRMAIPEWGVAIRPDGHGGGDNPYFVQKMFDFIQNPANSVVFHSYFGVSAGDIDARLTPSVTGDYPSGATRFPNASALYQQLFGSAAPAPTSPDPTSPAPAADTTPPTIVLTSPAENTVIPRRTSVTLAAAASDDGRVAAVEYVVNGQLVCRTQTVPYACSWNSGGKPRQSYTITGTAIDTAGNRASHTHIFSGR